MPPDELSQHGFTKSLVLAIGIPALAFAFALFARHYAEDTNRRLTKPVARSYFSPIVATAATRDRSAFRDYSILRFAINRYPRSGDPFLVQLSSHLAGQNFDMSSGESSSYFLADIYGVSSLATRLASGRQFASLYDFCRELLINNAFGDEREVLRRYWRKAETEEDLNLDAAMDDYVHYVVDTYTIPAVLAFKERRVVSARDLLAKACDRLLLMPRRPEGFDGAAGGSLANATFVLAALCDDEATAALEYPQVEKAVDCVVDDLPASARTNCTTSSKGGPDSIGSFVSGLYLLRERRYEECIAQFNDVLAGRPSERLVQLSCLIQLHCELMHRKQSGMAKKPLESLVNLRKTYEALKSSPFGQELSFYKIRLGE